MDSNNKWIQVDRYKCRTMIDEMVYVKAISPQNSQSELDTLTHERALKD